MPPDVAQYAKDEATRAAAGPPDTASLIVDAQDAKVLCGYERTIRRLSVANLAAKVGMTPNRLQAIEERMAAPTLDERDRIGKVLMIKPELVAVPNTPDARAKLAGRF
jgi:ribosome-binding protein aMBF1 (putative translation factor)